MTRGSGLLVTDKMVFYHDEFNGDMYPDGHGFDFIKMLNKTNASNFSKELKAWNKRNHDYEDFKTYRQPLSFYEPFTKFDNADVIALNFKNDYYKWFFSDWIFIKNGSKRCQIQVTTCDNNLIMIEPGETRAFSFGNSDRSYTA